MNLKKINTPAEYEQALADLETLMDAEPGTPEERELDLLSQAISEYEDKWYPIGPPDPMEAVKFREEQQEAGPDENTM